MSSLGFYDTSTIGQNDKMDTDMDVDDMIAEPDNGQIAADMSAEPMR